MNTITQPAAPAAPRIDDAARVRLESITSDRDVLEGFERLVKSGKLDDAFLAAVGRTLVSLHYLFTGEGKPFMSEAL